MQRAGEYTRGAKPWHWILWNERRREAAHHKNDFIILIVIRGRISIIHFLQYITIIRLFLLYIVLYINSFQIILYMLLGLTFPGQIKQKNEKKGTWLLASTESNTVQRNKEL